MTAFLNKKERVYDLRLTSYGKYLLSIGKFKAFYYGFYDDNILYDDRHGRVTGSQRTSDPTGQDSGQNYAHKRIKEETQYLESVVFFEQVEGTSPDYTEDIYTADMTPTQQEVKIDAFRFDSLIGDAYLDSDTRKLPAWKVIALQGKITSSATEDTSTDSRVPQLNMELNYTLEPEYYEDMVERSLKIPEYSSDLLNTTMPFKDGRVITLRMDDALIYVDEVNTSLLTENFDMEVFEVETDQIALHATSSVTFEANPSVTNTLVLSNNGVTKTFTFVASVSADPTEAAIGSTTFESLTNLVGTINLPPNAALKMVAAGPVATTPTVHKIYLTNQYPGIIGNASPYVQISGAFDPSTVNPTYAQMQGGKDLKESLRRLEFPQDVPQIVDGMMLSSTPPRAYAGIETTSSVEYFFNLAIDENVNIDTACKGAEIYNKQSYYIDLDFDCTETTTDEDKTLYDIYGPVTEPEICLD